jgi:DNA polymerase IV (DinB-like DNA polymerase)
MKRLHHEGFHSFRTVVLTVRFADFATKSRAHTLAMATNEPAILRREAVKMMLPFLDRRENPHRQRIRLLGLRVEKLSR